MTPTLEVFDTPADLVTGVAERLKQFLLTELQLAPGRVNIALTGGRTGIGVLAALAKMSPNEIDWSRVHVWWGDERWLPEGDSERNDGQAFAALLGHVQIPSENVHRVDHAAAGVSLEDAAQRYDEQLRSHRGGDLDAPLFALVMLGMGPDGHVASLFPHHPGLDVQDRYALAVRNSPKPPSERVSLSFEAINNAGAVWLMLSGDDKAAPLARALHGESRSEIPAGGVRGKFSTVFFADTSAASELS